jgi:spermidine/putrescine-binding protein
MPADAPHPDNAHKWLNYLMRPEVIADIGNVLKYSNGNKASLPFVQEAIKNDPAIYPDAKTRASGRGSARGNEPGNACKKSACTVGVRICTDT